MTCGCEVHHYRPRDRWAGDWRRFKGVIILYGTFVQNMFQGPPEPARVRFAIESPRLKFIQGRFNPVPKSDASTGRLFRSTTIKLDLHVLPFRFSLVFEIPIIPEC